MKKRLAGFVVVILVVVALTLGATARAKTQALPAGVVYSNVHGTWVSCFLPVTTGAFLTTCSVYASAGEATLPVGFCLEIVSVSIPPAQVGAGTLGCRVTVSGLITVVAVAARVDEETLSYTCVGAGFLTASFIPAPGSAASPMSGPVLTTWAGGSASMAGHLTSGGVPAAAFDASGFDRCGVEDETNPFEGAIN